MENDLLGGILQNIVLEKVVRDKIVTQQKEQREEEARLKREAQRDELDQFDDEETREIMRKMRNERERMVEDTPKHKQTEKRAIGEYRQIQQAEFLNYVTKLKHTVVHFFHKQFQRCKIMDKHLAILSQQNPNTQFLSINSEKCPFFVQKLGIRTLPTLCIFINGVMKDKILGFDGLSGDEFLTWELGERLALSGVVQSKKSQIKDKTVWKSKKKESESQGEDKQQ